MIKKLTYKELMTNNKFTTQLSKFNLSSNTDLKNLIEAVDNLFKAKVNFTSYNVLYNTFNYVAENFLYQGSTSGLWDDMKIFISSYKENDVRPLFKIYENLIQYLGFYKELITNNGLAKEIITHREYEDNSTSKSKNGDAGSETPQIDILDTEGNLNFDEAMKYASSVSKSEGEASQDRDGESDITVTSKSWEEKMKNLRLVFFSELNGYISSIPALIYNSYALETRPYTQLIKDYIENIEAISDNE